MLGPPLVAVPSVIVSSVSVCCWYSYHYMSQIVMYLLRPILTWYGIYDTVSSKAQTVTVMAWLNVTHDLLYRSEKGFLETMSLAYYRNSVWRRCLLNLSCNACWPDYCQIRWRWGAVLKCMHPPPMLYHKWCSRRNARQCASFDTVSTMSVRK